MCQRHFYGPLRLVAAGFDVRQAASGPLPALSLEGADCRLRRSGVMGRRRQDGQPEHMEEVPHV